MNSTMASHREFLVTFNTHYEAKSFLAGTNAARAGLNTSSLQVTNTLIGRPHVGNESFWVPQLANFPAYSLTQDQAPIFYSLNGYVLGNGAPYEMCRDDPVLWYIMVSQSLFPPFSHTSPAANFWLPQAFGEASHVFHMHGNNFKYLDQWQASMSLNAGEMFTLVMNAQLPGVWQLLCHVSSHNLFGMQQDYVVYETEGNQTCPLPPLTSQLAGSP